jgi:hypothetical protein
MEHGQAIELAAAEKYAMDELAEDLRRDYEEHFFGCPECAEDVRATSALVDTLQGVVLEQQSQRAVLPVRGQSRWGRLFFPLPLGAAATIVLLIGAVTFEAAVNGRLAGRLRDSAQIQATSAHFLAVSRGEPELIVAAGGQQSVALTLSRSEEQAFRYYRCDLMNADGRQMLSSVVPAPAPGEEFHLVLPLGGLAAGRYALVLGGMTSADGPVEAPRQAEYPFLLSIGEQTR